MTYVIVHGRGLMGLSPGDPREGAAVRGVGGRSLGVRGMQHSDAGLPRSALVGLGAVETDPNIVKLTQSALKARGFLQGAIDGLVGRQTIAAQLSYARFALGKLRALGVILRVQEGLEQANRTILNFFQPEGFTGSIGQMYIDFADGTGQRLVNEAEAAGNMDRLVNLQGSIDRLIGSARSNIAGVQADALRDLKDFTKIVVVGTAKRGTELAAEGARLIGRAGEAGLKTVGSPFGLIAVIGVVAGLLVLSALK